MNFEQDLFIDKNALDKEWIEQPAKMYAYSKAHAQAIFNRDRAKQALDITKANLDSSIRLELSTAGVKFTEAVVDGKIKTSPTYITSQENLIKAEFEVNNLMAGAVAMASRKVALENLVKLLLANYFSSPRATGEEMAAVTQQFESDQMNRVLNQTVSPEMLKGEPEKVQSSESPATPVTAPPPQEESRPSLAQKPQRTPLRRPQR